MFIVFEGIEGCGKSTQAQLLFHQLEKEGFPTLLTYEPGGTPIGKKLREILLNEPLDPLTEVLLFIADRREHIVKTIEPSLREGTIIISDRYIYSTLAYQAYGRGIKKVWIDAIHQEIVNNLFPDRTYLLDIEVNTAFYRKRLHTFDRIENESKEFHQRVREGFLELAKTNPTVRILDGSLSIETLQAIIWEDISLLLKERGKK